MKDRKENIVIDEQDLFNYVFFPSSVSGEKKELIESDISFDAVLDFYRQLRLNSEIKPDEELQRKIASKIPAYNLSNVIQLFDLKEPIVTKLNRNRLVADSKELKPKMTTKTFVDNDKEYLIKVLNYEGHTKIFVFSTKDEVVKNFDIIIEPHNLKFHFDDNSEPLKIEHSIQAEKIEIRFS
ncbi:MAG: hypothetical protein Q8N03_15610 [Ignavibacteria bacterium]|nr:hypothetical protein [Ignavibacteria bacterium]